MNTGLKVVLWILGILGGLVLIVITAGFFIGKSVMGDAKEGVSFSANATREGCVTEFSTRLKACDGVSCSIKASTFGAACLSKAKGNLTEFCEGTPKPTDQSAFKSWSGEFCSAHELKAEKCGMAAGVVASFCDSAMNNRK